MTHEASSEPSALAVDLGSGGLKVGVVSLRGDVRAVAETTLETEHTPDGGATQDAEAWWTRIRELARDVLGAVDRSGITAVACTGQWASTIPVDASGTPVGPCLMWLDTRGAEHARRVVGGPLLGYNPKALLTWVKRTAGIPSPNGGDPLSHILHLERDQPHIAAAARWYLEPVDYLSMRFTGRAAATLPSMSAAWLTDNRRPTHLAYDSVLLQMAGLTADKLPPLVRAGSVIGGLHPEVVRDLGLAPDVQVVTGAPDIHTSTVGTGAVRDGLAHTSISTTSWISLTTPRKKTDAIHSIATIPGLRPDEYLVANNQEAAGLCLRWLRDVLPGQRSYDELTALAATAAPGSADTIFAPWIAGERSPVDDRHARGGWHNLSVQVGEAELVRSVLEGVAYNSRWLCRAVERFARRGFEELRIFGGGAQSDLWCQIYADVLGRRILRVADPVHANLRGAALVAAHALGVVHYDELPELVPIERTFTPDAANRATYDRLYAEFTRLYKRQRRMFARLNRPH